MSHFNGAYSVRSGYHGPRKHSEPVAGFWTCDNGHVNPDTELIDERDKGGFTRKRVVNNCQRCGVSRLSAKWNGKTSDQTESKEGAE